MDFARNAAAPYFILSAWKDVMLCGRVLGQGPAKAELGEKYLSDIFARRFQAWKLRLRDRRATL